MEYLIKCPYYVEDMDSMGCPVYRCSAFRTTNHNICSYPNCRIYEDFITADQDSNKKTAHANETITLCGSTRFKDEFIAALETLTVLGWIVLLPGYYGHAGAAPITEEAKEALDKLHKHKIDISDAIYVINKDGYIGESTKSEIKYAQEHNKKIYYLEEI